MQSIDTGKPILLSSLSCLRTSSSPTGQYAAASKSRWSHIRNGFEVGSRRRHRLDSRRKSLVGFSLSGLYAHGSSQAASGIGRETALAFAEAGAKAVVFADINLEEAKKAADESKKEARHAEYRALAVELDIAEEASVQNLITTILQEFGRIDYAVNSAGVSTVLGRWLTIAKY